LLDYKEFPVLYVDDETENLRIFELTFRRRFRVLTAASGDEGLRVLNENPVAVVLSDHRMPNMTGTEFLSRSREIDDRAIRILVTAYGDARTLGEAINDGAIYRYLSKPWDPDEMEVTLRRAIEVYALDRERDALLSELTQLNQLSRGLYSELDLEALISLLLESSHQELGFDGVALLLVSPAGDDLIWAGIAPDNPHVNSSLRSIRISRSTAPQFFARLEKGECQLLHIDHLMDVEGPVRQWMTEVSAEEIVVVPLAGKDGIIGALAVDNRSGGKKFGADERTLLDGVATQATIAIDNARLVDDLRRSREQVLRADRLGTLGTLAAGLAHEINNPLVSIHTFLSLAPQKRATADPEFWGDYHQLACREVERIRGLVATMSNLARGDSGQQEVEPVEVGHLAREVSTLMGREALAASVDLSVAADPLTPKILAVRDHLHQVFMNLILNAVHATPPGGQVRVICGPDPARPEDGVEIRVEDTGRGIPEENLERIFDPFFTTKDPDQGTGLGLMITHQIVADHGGTIDVRSRVGDGSAFTLRLPVRPPAVSARLLRD